MSETTKIEVELPNDVLEYVLAAVAKYEMPLNDLLVRAISMFYAPSSESWKRALANGFRSGDKK